ncbi:MAG: outer membrane protein assembly factor BamE [Pseudomonadota bacterium]
MIRILKTVSLACITTLIVSGCSMPKIPRVHKVSVQQGNVLTQEMIDKLKPGMTRSQVAYIMGEPILRNTFNDSRWEYVYTIVVPGYVDSDTHMTLFFENDVLSHFVGDFLPSDSQGGETPEGTEQQSTTPAGA